MASDKNKPYSYPTADMTAAYSASLNSVPGGRITTLNTSQLGAPTAQQGGALSRFRNWLGIKIIGADAGTALFPPQQPLQPVAQRPEDFAVGRPWDYPVGYNTRVIPRDGTISFDTLKNLAVGYDVLAIIIQRLKDKIVSEEWTIGPKNEKGARDAQMDEIHAFLEMPDKNHTWDEWLKMLIDQVVIYDAPAIWLQPTRGGDLYALEILDGSKFTPKIGPDGRIPSAFMGPGYQQVLKGLPAVDYVKPLPKGVKAPLDPDGNPMPELLYKPKNPRVDSVYGYSPVEQIITTVNIALRRETFLLTYYTDGSTPDLIFGVPDTWNPTQITQFKMNWDSMLAGNLQNRRGTMFVPSGVKPFDVREKALTDGTDEWLIKICCFALGQNPMPFIKQMNKGQEKTHHEEAGSEGLAPWMEWIKNLMDYIIALKFGRPDVVFRWKEAESTDELTRAQIDQIMIANKIYHPDEVRQARGDNPMPPEMRGQMDMATFSNTPNATILPPDQQAVKDEQSLAMQAAKPAPVVAPTADDKAKKGMRVTLVKKADGTVEALIK
jgi:hypothetical protein